MEADILEPSKSSWANPIVRGEEIFQMENQNTVFPKNKRRGRLFFRKVAKGGVYFRPAFILDPAFIFS